MEGATAPLKMWLGLFSWNDEMKWLQLLVATKSTFSFPDIPT